MSEQIWEQLPQENDEAFEAFTIYLMLPTSERSALRALNTYERKYNLTVSDKINKKWAGWSKSFQWVKRVDVYDTYKENEIRRYVGKEQINELIEFRKQQRRLSAKVADTAILLIEAATARLKTLNPDEISANVLPQYLKAAAAIAELASQAEAKALLLKDITEAYLNNFDDKDDFILDEIEEENLEVEFEF